MSNVKCLKINKSTQTKCDFEAPQLLEPPTITRQPQLHWANQNYQNHPESTTGIIRGAGPGADGWKVLVAQKQCLWSCALFCCLLKCLLNWSYEGPWAVSWRRLSCSVDMNAGFVKQHKSACKSMRVSFSQTSESLLGTSPCEMFSQTFPPTTALPANDKILRNLTHAMLQHRASAQPGVSSHLSLCVCVWVHVRACWRNHKRNHPVTHRMLWPRWCTAPPRQTLRAGRPVRRLSLWPRSRCP